MGQEPRYGNFGMPDEGDKKAGRGISGLEEGNGGNCIENVCNIAYSPCLLRRCFIKILRLLRSKL